MANNSSYYVDWSNTVGIIKPPVSCELNQQRWYSEFVYQLGLRQILLYFLIFLYIIYVYKYYKKSYVDKPLLDIVGGLLIGYIILSTGLQVIYFLKLENNILIQGIFTFSIIGYSIKDWLSRRKPLWKKEGL